MLRASKKITVNCERLRVQNGFMLSQIIDINGLVLRADNQELVAAQNMNLELMPKAAIYTNGLKKFRHYEPALLAK